MNYRLVILLLVLVVPFSASAVDFDLKVLAVMAPGAVNDDNISDQLRQIETTWSNTGITTFATVSLANADDANGNPIKPNLNGPAVVSTNHLATYQLITSGAYNLAALRDQYEADLVIVLLPSSAMPNACGFAPQTNWTSYDGIPGVYVPDPALYGLDLNGAEDSFVALYSTSAACTQIQATNNQQNSIAHEFGHLLGAGHDLEQPPPATPPLPGPDPIDFYLTDESHAFVSVTSVFGITFASKSVMARQDFIIGKCVTSSAGACYASPMYSSSGTLDNANTLAITSWSVANYRPVPTPCGLTKPGGVVGNVILACTPGTGLTWHIASWYDDCPAATEYYEVHRSLTSAFGPYSFGWTTQSKSTEIFNNIDGWIKVKACNSTDGCSGKSDTLYFAPALCFQ